MTELLLTELDREVERSRRALEQVPDGKYDWKPHDKSMIFGYLADMVATMPSWVAMEITQDELDVAPAEGSKVKQAPNDTSEALLKALDKARLTRMRRSKKTTEEHLMTTWRLLARGQVVMETPRHVMIQDTINHWAHHRGQMTVYLRLMGARSPPCMDHRRTTIGSFRPESMTNPFLIGLLSFVTATGIAAQTPPTLEGDDKGDAGPDACHAGDTSRSASDRRRTTLVGELEKGRLAIGGETTGWILHYRDDSKRQTIEVDFGKGFHGNWPATGRPCG